MPRFSGAFSRRKSTVDDLQNVPLTDSEPTPSFRVFERNDAHLNTKSFDGGARYTRSSLAPKPVQPEIEDNMFADLHNTRGSGASNTTKATSTDTSSRHSNASTAPSSADLTGKENTGYQNNNTVDSRSNSKKSVHDNARLATPKSNSFLNKAGRTFSFGQRKNSASPKDSDIPEVPPVPDADHNGGEGRARGMTESTASTATPPKLETGGGMDMGGDFGSMFMTMDKRTSTATVRPDGASAPRSLTGSRSAQPAALYTDQTSPVENPLTSWSSQSSGERLLASPLNDRPPPVPNHRDPYGSLNRRPYDIAEDEDVQLMRASLSAGNFLAGASLSNEPPSRSYRRNDNDGLGFYGKTVSSSFTKDDENMFDSSMSRLRRQQASRINKISPPPKHKVMTPQQFEQYRKDKESQDPAINPRKKEEQEAEEDDDDINYDDDEDEAEKSKLQTKQRRKQEAHMAVYRQQMMKVTGEPARSLGVPPSSARPNLNSSLSAPQLSVMKAPSPVLTASGSEEEDDDVPLGILQAHGFPHKTRPPTRLSTFGSNPNLRAASVIGQQQVPSRPSSAMGDNSSGSNQRHSNLPAFARHLPQDPFVGAGIAKPAVRESLSFSGGSPASQSSLNLPPGGLVGVIASEERSRAMRRGSPSIDKNNFTNNAMNGGQGFDPTAGIPPHMMYNQGGMANMPQMPGPMPSMASMPSMSQMQQMPPSSMSHGEQAQMQLNQQMQQFMQMQMQFMQMMASNQNPNAPQSPQQQPQPPPQQQPYANGSIAFTQSMGDLSAMMNSQTSQSQLEPPQHLNQGMRTLSMVQPGPPSFMGHGYSRSIHASGQGYTPSIAPSERSNVGLPGRYRPVSQAVNPPAAVSTHSRTVSGTGSMHRWDENKASVVSKVNNAADGSDEDDEEGWAAMQAKREKKRSMWRSKKDLGEVAAMM